nr:sigma-54-dependent Fis family transcriptional regulator [Gammaproteobacteria bacterium]
NLVNSAMKLSAPHAGIDRRSRDQLLGESAVMCQVRSTIAKLARSQAPVYISGESGTGKELVAQLIHQKGPRAEKPFIPVNCGAIPTELMESEFFGHKKGSFTGAVSDKQGLFQAAQGGTLFLDEIAELPMHMQVKLLRAIQEKAIRPIGGHQEIPIDVRILSATHKDLAIKVKNDEFRQDLFYRINVINITVPPLRDRSEDIPQLVEHILNRLQSDIVAEKQHPLSDDAMQALQHYPFSGNVRELENILERAIALCEGAYIGKHDLHLPDSDHDLPETDTNDLDHALDNRERLMITKALENSRYNKTAAAKLLGISYRALRYRLKKYNIE